MVRSGAHNSWAGGRWNPAMGRETAQQQHAGEVNSGPRKGGLGKDSEITVRQTDDA